jgi:hypothetical protein
MRVALAGTVTLAASVGSTTACLDRPVKPDTPKTSNVFIELVQQTKIDKIDLLFVIDNSISMADKQAFFADAVPSLVDRLISPQNDEFEPINDIHIGVVTSSLGGHGGSLCSPASGEWNETQNDRAWLVGLVRSTTPAGDPVTSYNGFGFLAWDPTGKLSPPGESSAPTLIQNFQNQVEAAGELGCGFEATLEAWYRFLIDPEPPLEVVLNGQTAVAQGIDQDVLSQRAAFLRPDSLVAVIMLSDENDCSVVDGGIGWLTTHPGETGSTFHMPRPTSTCGTDPNSACCRSCAVQESSPPEGCQPVASDPDCQPSPPVPVLNNLEDPLNLRCYQQKQRFGFDLLHSTQRYVNGLTQGLIPNQAGDLVPNPLFVPGEMSTSRNRSLVFLAGIVGVPWQDIATPETLDDPAALEYMTADELNAAGRWATLIGDIGQRDPFMVESVQPRSGTNMIANVSITPPEGAFNAINGHEQAPLPGSEDDLQYACIFPLNPPRDCSDGSGETACDCFADELESNRPLCHQDGGGAVGTTQYYAKAYPGTRHLQVLRDFGANSIVASICPKNVTGDTTDASYGYNPAVNAIIDRLKEVLSGRCLPRRLAVDENNQVPCKVVETARGGLSCDVPGRAPINPDEAALLVPAVLEQLETENFCGTQFDIPCEEFAQMCEIVPAGNLCQNQQNATPEVGYCYVDPDPPASIGNAELVANCPASERRLLRFVGDDTPRGGAVAFIACFGDSFQGITPAGG